MGSKLGGSTLNMISPDTLAHWTEAFMHAGLAAGIAIGAAIVIHYVIFAIWGRITRLSRTESDDIVLARMREPLRWVILAITVSVAAEANSTLGTFWEKVARFVVPALMGWTVYALVQALATILDHHAERTLDDLSSRSRRTRVGILSRTAGFVIIFITISLMLLGIPGVRNVGVTLMASAGLAGLAVGAAAQPALKSLIAGLQMALTEPIRLGDLVKVDGHTGRVEAIKSSFVIIRAWDERRIVVPTNRFLENTFENWTRQGDKLTGGITLFVDPATEIAPIRTEFQRLVASQPLWDKRKAELVVLNAQLEAIELRLTVSAANSTNLSDLSNIIREGMLDWLRHKMPTSLLHHNSIALEPASSDLNDGKDQAAKSDD